MTTPALTLVMTTAGLGRFTAAQVEDDIDLTIATVGLTDTPFVAAPSLTALPGEFRRLTTVSGQAIGDNIVHMILRDPEPVTYQVSGFGLYLADGTLFAVYGQPDPMAEKSPISTLMLAIDIAFPTTAIANITFGDTNFLNPPATAETPGVVELATQTEGRAGSDPRRVPSVAVTRDMIGQTVPAGLITLWFGSAETVPGGWAICNGETADRADGSGPITTPDLRGRVAVGASDDHAFGTKFGAAQVDTAFAGKHAHTATATINQAASGVTVSTTTRNVDAGGSANGVVTLVTVNDPSHTHTATAVVEEAGEHKHTVDVVQPSMALHYIMRL